MTPSEIRLKYRTRLRQLLTSHFDEGELQTLCFDLGVDYESLPGEGKADRARELVEYLERRGRIQECVVLGKQLRPDVPWESLPDRTKHPSQPLLPSGKPIPWSWIASVAGLAAVALILFVLVLNGGGGEDGKPTDTPATAAAVVHPLTDTPRPTATPEPTDTPTSTSTATPRPTDTPTPTSTPIGLGRTMTRERDGAVMVYVPGGEFEMGSSQAEIDAAFEQCERDRGSGECSRWWFEDESPQHSVTRDSFWIDRTEVTNAQFAVFLNERGNQTEGGATWLDLQDGDCLIEQVGAEYQPKRDYDDHPVIEVTWYGASAYCEWASAQLPTEAEWEYAARGPQGNTYPWGEAEPNCELAQFDGCSGGMLPVGSFPDGASWCGALDMAGNAWEWVDDWYDGYPGTTYQSDDFGTLGKVVRGGSWGYSVSHVSSAKRDWHRPGLSDPNFGFRCVGAATSSP